MSGKRTLLSLAIALVSIICAAFGVDFGALLSDLGITADDLMAGETGGKLNLIVAAVSIVAAAIFRVIARRMVLRDRPLDRPQSEVPPHDGGGSSQLLLAGLALALLLAGCAQPAVEPAVPETIRQSLASAWIAHGKANKDITDLRRAQLISADTFRRWADELDRIEQRLEQAEGLIALGRSPDAGSALSQALEIMTRLQPLIQEKLDEAERVRGAEDRQ